MGLTFSNHWAGSARQRKLHLATRKRCLCLLAPPHPGKNVPGVFLHKSAAFCEKLCLPNGASSMKAQRSAKICENWPTKTANLAALLPSTLRARQTHFPLQKLSECLRPLEHPFQCKRHAPPYQLWSCFPCSFLSFPFSSTSLFKEFKNCLFIPKGVKLPFWTQNTLLIKNIFLHVANMQSLHSLVPHKSMHVSFTWASAAHMQGWMIYMYEPQNSFE